MEQQWLYLFSVFLSAKDNWETGSEQEGPSWSWYDHWKKKIDQLTKLFNSFQYGISIDWRTSHTQPSQQKKISTTGSPSSSCV